MTKNFYKKDFKNKNKKFIRINFNIKSPSVRVVRDGQQLGVYQVDVARRMAFDAGLDLVEVAPQATPPVCAILSFDKYRYELSQKEKENKKKQKTIETKEIRFRPVTQTHDLETKVSAVKKFIGEGKKVSLVVQYAKREFFHKEAGFKLIAIVLEQLKDFILVEITPKFEGSKLFCRIAPKKVESEVINQ
jgi:translation initiation factor IF-3